MAKAKKLNSMRVLEANKIPYESFAYDDAAFHDALEVAEMIGAPDFHVYKTLVIQSAATDKPMIAILAADRTLDLKKMAQAAGEKKVKMAKHADAERMTGLQVGGISALMLLDKHWPIYVDSAMTELQNVYISAGQRGMQLRVPVTPLLGLLRAKIADLSADEASEAEEDA